MEELEDFFAKAEQERKAHDGEEGKPAPEKHRRGEDREVPEKQKNPGKKRTKRKKRRHLGLWFLAIFLLLFSLLAATAFFVLYAKYGEEVLSCRNRAREILRDAKREDFRKTQTGFIYARDGSVLKTLRNDRDVYYLTYEQIPETVIQAMIVTEDKKFFSHPGVDYLANLRAVYSLVKHKGTIYQGGSTITQQLARNIYLTNEQTYERKLTEIFLALGLEKRYQKTEILEFYLNNIYFANGFYGIQAAAYGYFSKGAAELSLSQLMFLCAIPNNPSLYDPYLHMEDTLQRRDSVMEQMVADGVLTPEKYREACEEEIVLCPKEQPYDDYLETFAVFCAVRALMEKNGFTFCYRFTEEGTKETYLQYYSESYQYWQQQLYTGGYRVYTSLDPEKQKLLLKTVQEQLAEFEEKNENGGYALQGAATCVDNGDGRVVAIVGGRGENKVGYSLNRAFQSFRQPGSSIKPLVVYTPWLERGYFPDTIVVDEKFPGGPRNANYVYSGKITLRRAVEVSKNTVAWKLFEQLTPEVGLSYVTAMGFRNIVWSDYVPAASLGGLTYGVCTLEMAGAYCALANDGVFVEPTCIVKITDAEGRDVVGEYRQGTQIYEKNAARMMTNILQGVMTNGTGVKLQLKNSVSAGKTGTTNDIKDGWFVGYTPYYTTAVWVGYDMPRPLTNLAGNTYPGYIWQKFMDELHQELPKQTFPMYEDDRLVKVWETVPEEDTEVPVDLPDWAKREDTNSEGQTSPPEGASDSGEESRIPEGQGGLPEASEGEGGSPEASEGEGGLSEGQGGPPDTPEGTDPEEQKPTTGWIEYEDDWWESQGQTGGYDDFYE